jgi:glycosyltransferase involved in cell wall biosynthesis
LRIGVDCRALSKQKTGIGYYIWEVLNEWGKQQIDHELVLYSPFDFELPDGIRNSNVCYRKRLFPVRPRELWMHTVLPLQMLRDRIDVYWGPNYAMPAFGVNVPTVLTVHDMVYKVYPKSLRYVTYLHNRIGLQMYTRFCSRIIADSENTKGDLVRYLNLPEERITVIPLGVSDRFTKHSEPEVDKRMLANVGLSAGEYLLTSGTLEPRKNLDRVIRAFQVARASRGGKGNFVEKLVIVGSDGWGGVKEELEKVADPQIVHLGYVSDEMLAVLYRSARAFVYMSLYEGFGLPPLEAMRCGTPVLVSNASSLPEVVADCGLYADPLSVEDIAVKMAEIVGPEGQSRLSRAGLERARGMAWSRTAAEIQHVLEASYTARTTGQ